MLIKEKEKNIKEKYDLINKIQYIDRQITFIIIKLQNMSEKIKGIAMNKNHLMTENDYIDSLLLNEIGKMGINNEEEMKVLKKIKENYWIFKEVNNFKKDELMYLDDSQLAEKLKIIIPKTNFK